MNCTKMAFYRENRDMHRRIPQSWYSTVMGKAELVKRFAKCGREMEEMPVTKKLYILNH